MKLLIVAAAFLPVGIAAADAWAEPSERAYAMSGEGWWWCDCTDHANKRSPIRRGNGPTPDAARLAAAQAVLPSLPADVRAELGECP
jgi:hypothetical protein